MGWRAKEKYISEIKSRTGWTQNKEWAFAAAGYLPLSPSILVEFEKNIKNVYHVTDIKSYPKLKTIQNRRIDIAGFTKASTGVVKGLLTDGELLVTLKGQTSVIFEGDVNTELDRNGIRWIKPNGNVSQRANDIVYEFSVDIGNKVIDNFDVSRADPAGNRSKVPEHIAIHNWIWDKPGSIKRQFLKYYYAEAKKLVNKPLIDSLNKALGWRDNQNISHNEILLHNFQIIDTKLIISEEKDKEIRMWDRAEKARMEKLEIITEGDVYDLGN